MEPYRVHYLFNEQRTPPLKFGAGVSTKNFKRAVDRNRIKRLTKEAWRVQKIILQKKLKEKKSGLNVFIIYTGKELPGYKEVYSKMTIILNKLEKCWMK